MNVLSISLSPPLYRSSEERQDGPVLSGDEVHLIHVQTKRLLNSHDVAAPLSPALQEVAGYINYSAQFVPYFNWKLVRSHQVYSACQVVVFFGAESSFTCGMMCLFLSRAGTYRSLLPWHHENKCKHKYIYFFTPICRRCLVFKKEIQCSGSTPRQS